MKKTQPRAKTSNNSKKSIDKKPSDHSWLWFIFIPLLTILIYNAVTGFDSTNWDDKAYLKETAMVRGLSAENTKAIFSGKVLNSYNPIVLLTFAFDHKMSKLKPEWCHKVNLFFHVLNALLVFICMRKLRFRNEYAGFIAVLFAVHPLATEAVAWIAGRKDVVYLFFFLLSWKFYLDFYHSNKKLFFVISIFFFILSLLSKVQAITLPFILIASDLILDQKFISRKLLNKIFYLIPAIIFGIIAISGSGDLVADKYSVPVSFFDKIIYSVMAFGLYFVKIISPFNQIAIYQFPQAGTSSYIIYLLIGIATIALLGSVFFIGLKKNPRLSGGILFFAMAIFPVLHIVALNSALIYERFVYLADIGIFIAVFSLAEKMQSQQKKFTYAIFAVSIFFSVLTYARIPVWKNSISLWTDVIEKDNTVADAFTNRGQFYDMNGEDQKAFADFSESIKLQPKKPGGYHNRAVSYFKMRDFKNALIDNQRVLDIDPRHTDGLVNRGAIYFNMNENDSAIFYYMKAIEVTPNSAKAYYNCGAAYFNKKNYEEASRNFRKATEIIHDYVDAYTYLAMSEAHLGRYDQTQLAINAAEKYATNSAAREMTSNEFIRMGNQAYQDKKVDEAMTLYTKASEIMPSNPEAYYSLGGIYLMQNNVGKAREYWQKTLDLNPNHTEAKNWMARTAK